MAVARPQPRPPLLPWPSAPQQPQTLNAGTQPRGRAPHLLAVCAAEGGQVAERKGQAQQQRAVVLVAAQQAHKQWRELGIRFQGSLECASPSTQWHAHTYILSIRVPGSLRPGLGPSASVCSKWPATWARHVCAVRGRHVVALHWAECVSRRVYMRLCICS